MKQMLFFLLLATSIPSFAQDLLVTNARDTLNCKLGNLNSFGFYPISFLYYDTLMTGEIHKDSVLFFKKNVFRSLYNNTLRRWYSFMDFDVDFGLSHLTGEFRHEHDLYGEDVPDKSDFIARTGWYAGAELNFMHSKRLGYGIKYNFRSYVEGKLTHQYVGPAFIVRFYEHNKRNNVCLNFSGGYAWATQKDAPIQNINIRTRLPALYAKCFAANIALTYNFRIADNTSLHLKASYALGYPDFIYIQDVQKYTNANSEPLPIDGYCSNINAFNLTFGLTFHR
jgi:hypothetical protein